MSTSPFLIRPMQADDVPAMLAVQAQCYPLPMNESGEVLLARWQTCGDTAWVACDAQGRVVAYLVAHRTRCGQMPALGEAFEHADHAQVLHLHDLAIGLQARGQGLALHLLREAGRHCGSAGLEGMTLVSVNDSHAFWFRLGWRDWTSPDANDGALSTYGGKAAYMAIGAEALHQLTR